MANILILSNAGYARSGYGTQAALLAKMLQKNGHNAAIAAFYGLHGAPMVVDGIQHYPGSGENPWSLDVLPAHYQNFGADLLITLMDAWVLDPALMKDRGMNVAHWMPVDCEPLSVKDRAVLDGLGARPVAMSRFGERQLLAAGFDPLYVPHSLDLSVWKPLEGKEAARERVGLAGKFIVAVNAANQDPVRKGFGEALAAFAAFAGRHDDVVLLMHTRMQTAQGGNLDALVKELGLEGRVMFCDQYAYASGVITEDQMAAWHGLADVFLNPAYAEGFGLGPLQSQAAGVPVIVADNSAMAELCGAGWLVAGQRWWHHRHEAWWQVPFVTDIERALEDAYGKARDPGIRQLAREFALQYDADRVWAEHWEPALAELLPKAGALPAGKRRVWAPVMFRDETAMLEMRLAESAGLVDRHVVVESGLTHRGLAKPTHLGEIMALSGGEDGRVTYVTAELDPAGEPWVNEHAQRDAAWAVIDAEADDSDVVLITDLDEILSPALLKAARAGQLPEVCSVRLKVALHAVDLLVPDDLVPPQCVIATAGYIRRHGGSLAAVRDKRHLYQVIPDGGWHFSWLGTPAEQAEKLDTATCHTELLGTPEADLIRSGARRAGEHRGGLPVVPVSVDDSWPEWVRYGRAPASWYQPRAIPVVPSVPGDVSLMVTAFKRPDYLERVLDSWIAAGAAGLRRIVVALGQSPAEDQQRQVIAAAAQKMGRDVDVIMDSPACAEMWGPHRAIAEAASQIFAGDPGCGFLILSEEDIAVSDDALRFLAWGREQAAGRAVAVCAHNPLGSGWQRGATYEPGSLKPRIVAPPPDDSDADQETARFSRSFSPWAWATWREVWQEILEPNWDFDVSTGSHPLQAGYDWQVQRIVVATGDVLVPDASRSQNIGVEGGLTADSGDFGWTQAKSFREVRGEVSYRLEDSA